MWLSDVELLLQWKVVTGHSLFTTEYVTRERTVYLTEASDRRARKSGAHLPWQLDVATSVVGAKIAALISYKSLAPVSCRRRFYAGSYESIKKS